MDSAGGENRAEGADVDPIFKHDIAVLRVHARLTPEKDATTDSNPIIRGTFCIQHAVVVDYDVMSDANLVRVAQRHPGAKKDVSPARAQETWI